MNKFEKLERKLCKKYKIELCYVNLKNVRGLCIRNYKIIFCPKPKTEMDCLIFFHELVHAIYHEKITHLIEEFVTGRGLSLMMNELNKMEKKK